MGDTSLIQMVARITSALTNSGQFAFSVLYPIESYKDKISHEQFDDPTVIAMVQTDSNTSCGWGGVAGQAFTSFWLVVIEYSLVGVAIVYQGRVAYVCEIDDEYRKCIENRNMPFWDDLSRSKLKILWRATR